MNNELIRTESALIGGEKQQTVNARELWMFLESGTQFNHWIKRRISRKRYAKNPEVTKGISARDKILVGIYDDGITYALDTCYGFLFYASCEGFVRPSSEDESRDDFEIKLSEV